LQFSTTWRRSAGISSCAHTRACEAAGNGFYSGIGRAGGNVDKEPVEFLEFTVPFRDVDKHGKMFSAVYVHRAEEALATFWARRPASGDDPHFTVGKVTCTFHAALHQGDVVR